MKQFNKVFGWVGLTIVGAIILFFSGLAYCMMPLVRTVDFNNMKVYKK